jgi:7-cyano-7-deazaguanine synthase
MGDEIKKAVVLLSGGVDSATALAIARAEGYEVYALSFHYGQRHAIELEHARLVARAMAAAEHRIMSVDMWGIGGSALTSTKIDVPKCGPVEGTIPVTYVPARNTIFLSHALAWAEVLGAWDIFIGANAVDYSGYPDCRPEYLEAFERMANLATKAAVEGRGRLRIHAPLLRLTKAEIIRLGLGLGVDYGLTWSCYDPTPDGMPCGRCDSCVFRDRGFREADRPSSSQQS